MNLSHPRNLLHHGQIELSVAYRVRLHAARLG
jgi:hypothetical protein